ncbi:hypothetical protein GX50_05560 [[Emmonsia] crescens]|uniref:Granulins domain-containing protein n=1 Tax=[Emmonsia] crescens TaxID=73230 RepID=A0A2B7ZCH5_9EURO|nr:hypothetical protein GX50_05560 [Emmonsia crescens]
MKTSITLLLAVAAGVIMARPTADAAPDILRHKCPPEGAPCGYYVDCCPGLTCCYDHDWKGIGKCGPI